MKHRLFVLCTLVLAAMGILVVPRAHAFDTGPHYDLSQEALKKLGFNDTSIKIAQIQNWYVDFFSSISFAFPTQADDLAKLHCDNMPTMDMSSTLKIRNYMSHLTYNTQRAIHQAVFNHDKILLMTYIGMSLHAVQDFYSHSTWVEQHERIPFMPYRTETWFNSQPVALTLNLRTGFYPNRNLGDLDHGDYTYGTNHDAPGLPSPGLSAARSRFDEAYTFAYIASLEWINACHKWADEVDPSFWAAAQQIPLTPALDQDIQKDQDALYRLSEWSPSTGGHWKGPGSADAIDFGGYSAVWIGTTSQFRDMFVFGNVQKLLSDGITSDTFNVDAPPVNAYLPENNQLGFVKLDTTWVQSLYGFDATSAADFYSRIYINGQWFTEAMQLNTDAVTPPWSTIKFVDLPVPQVNIEYQLWDEDTAAAGLGDKADINPSKLTSFLDFSFDFTTHNLTGAVTGIHDVTPVVSTGEKGAAGRSQVQFTVTSHNLNLAQLVPNKQMKGSVNPSQVDITVLKKTVKGNVVYIEQSKTVPITFHVVDAVTNQPLTGYVYKYSPYAGEPLLAVTDTAFNYTFSSDGASHDVPFKIYVPGYDSVIVNVSVNRIAPP